MTRYKIIRFFQNDQYKKQVIKRNLTLAEAQEHCSNPETCSKTATCTPMYRGKPVVDGWFDGYESQ